MKMSLKYLGIGPHGLSVVGILALSIILRIILISHSWPVLDSDEGTMGIMALHVAYHGATPVFFYGQNYMGSLEAYVAAPMFYLFGPSVFALHFGLLFIYAFALVIIYLLTSALYTERFALFTLALLAFGSSEMFARQLTATGGYPESFFFEPLLLLYAFRLASTAHETPLTGKRRWRVLAYTGWIAIAGLAVWSHPLMAPFILVSGWLLVRFCFRELPWRPIALLVIACALLVTITYVAYNKYPLDQSITATLRFIFRIQGNTFTIPPLGARIAGTVFIALPRATGWNVPCYISNDGGPSLLPPHPLPTNCVAVGGVWGAGFLLLLATSAVLTFTTYRALRRTARTQPLTCEQRQAVIRHFARLMLIAGAILTILLYVNSSAPGLDPWISTRYLVGLSIALPAVLWPLWQTGQSLRRSLFARGIRLLSSGFLLVIALIFILGWAQTLNLIPDAQQKQQQDTALISSLLKVRAIHIYTDYWTCDRITFESAERIICSVVDEQLQPGLNRSPFYAPVVAADPHAAWVFPLNSPQAKTFSQQAPNTLSSYRLLLLNGYAIYLPLT
jgi:hypothetical protein